MNYLAGTADAKHVGTHRAMEAGRPSCTNASFEVCDCASLDAAHSYMYYMDLHSCIQKSMSGQING